MSITSEINTALIKGEKNIVTSGGRHEVKSAFICMCASDVTLDGSNCEIVGNGNVLEVKGAQNVTIKNFAFVTDKDKDFTVNVSKSNKIVFENCKFSSKTGCIVIANAGDVTIKNCDFSSEQGNGICVLNESVVNVENCNFTLPNGEGVTVIDNKDGMVTVHNNSFKRCYLALKSTGRNTLKVTNNYFLTYACAIEIFPSLATKDAEGLHKAEIRYNLFDECCIGGGEATVVIKGSDKGYDHREITITENIFSQKERPVINATSVNYLIFKENNVRTNDESTVENSIINGIKA